MVLRCRELAGASPPFPEKIAAHRSDTAVHVVHVVPSMQSDGSRQGGSDPVAQQEEGSAVEPQALEALDPNRPATAPGVKVRGMGPVNKNITAGWALCVDAAM